MGVPDDDPYKKMYDIGQDRAKARVNKSGNLLFHGESASSRARCASRELCQGSVPGQFSECMLGCLQAMTFGRGGTVKQPGGPDASALASSALCEANAV